MGNQLPADQEPDSFEAAPSSQDQSSRPIAKFSGSGGIQVAVWKHKSSADQGPDRYSVRIDRTYKDESGYHTTAYLRDGDLLRARALLQQADAFIEQEKLKSRGSAATDQGQVRF